MIEDLIELLEIQGVPQETKKNSQNETRTKSKKTTSSIKNDLRRLSLSKQVSIMEKIKQRKDKEEVKKKKLMKFVNKNKNKKINLGKFLNRMHDYEQKRIYDLDLKKFEQLQKDTSSLREKPKINKISLKIFENLPKEPLYKRTEEVLDEKKKRIENLSVYFILPKEIQQQREVMRNRYKKKYYSTENTKNDFDEYDHSLKTSSRDYSYLNKKKKKKEKTSKPKKDNFYDKQELWLKKAKIKYMEKLNQKQNLTYSDVTFHPHVNQVSLDILEMKNKINSDNDDIYKYNITNNNNNRSQDLILNKGKTIYDKLYQDYFKKYRNLQDYFNKSVNYYDSYNKNYNYNIYKIKKRNKFKSSSAKFLNSGNNKKDIKKYGSFHQRNINNKEASKKNNLKINKTMDELNTIWERKDISQASRNLRKLKQNISNYGQSEKGKNKKKKANDNFKWKNKLINLKSLTDKSVDETYHLNIRQNGAWKMDSINFVDDKKPSTRDVIKSIITN